MCGIDDETGIQENQNLKVKILKPLEFITESNRFEERLVAEGHRSRGPDYGTISYVHLQPIHHPTTVQSRLIANYRDWSIVYKLFIYVFYKHQ